ncbi:hypothetical protein EMIHUDRAFT_239957 [Emiliania huxleyi CCMP1516]|uniref:ShKT domain-containing protein n=2 Tax=Emiliania huxleyi TaxID=2903 RepID=A0A0D3JIB2_EMIH1|nr:hypothetical protein EMIHUDRAFT_239957 [Emiliania huxleyi CCMP1516]EOD23247.1 hypothetical protein EMIHUDRAFT_239957 [Emiliania huxleyi CCMP1516]|eukprot:XP_005775676.1 hypothetical protein EMIHUDRAFT_239957 [Emiliania huxleyi CCMP1516]
MVESELSSRITTIATLEAENVKLKAENATLEAENVKLKAENATLRNGAASRNLVLSGIAGAVAAALAIALWGSIVSTVAYVEITSKMDDEASMRITSQTPELASLRNADDDCPVAVHETKTVLRETLVFGPSAGGRRRLATTEGACKSPLSVARLYETGVVDVVLPCVTCDGAKSFPVFTPRELKERPDRFVIEGHLGGKFDQLYEVYCPFARAECEANPNLLCSIAEVPDDGSDPEHNFSGGEAMPEPEPESEPEPEPAGRQLAAEELEDLDVSALSNALASETRCADGLDRLPEAEVERLLRPFNLPESARTCSDLLFLGACELKIVQDTLCAQTCGVCEGEERDHLRERRQMFMKCGGEGR